MTGPDGRIHVFLVDDHNVMRSGLRVLLDTEDDLEVIGEAASGEDALASIGHAAGGPGRPDVVLMDLMMEDMNGVEATRRLQELDDTIAVLVLTTAHERGFLRDAFQAGASGYVVKDAADVELVEAIRTVAEGGHYVHPSLGLELTRAAAEMREGAEAHHGVPLTKREVEVARLITLGHSNREVGEQLFISVRTVETHRSRIMQKLGLSSRAELVRFTMDAGLVKGDGPG